MSHRRNPREFEPTWVDDVLGFWFGELSEAQWFGKDGDLDARIRRRFLAVHEHLVAHAGEGASTPCGLLATVIVIDQFSRNMFRGEPRAYAADAIALRLARHAVEHGLDSALDVRQRLFLYLPFEHSEDTGDQALSVELIRSLGNAEWTADAVEHKEIVDRFGRFPHRNSVLGRRSTPEEIMFLRSLTNWY